MTTPVSTVIDRPPGWPTIVPHLIYDDVDAATAWLCATFGFAERSGAIHLMPDGRRQRTQLDVGDSIITIGRPGIHGASPKDGVSTMLYVYVDEVDAHLARALAGGAQVTMPIEGKPWGDRTYQATDLEGHPWTFAQHMPGLPLASH